MVTQLVMISTIGILTFTGFNFFKRAKKFNLPSVRAFACGLFLIAFAILFYSARDFFIQAKLYDVQTKFLVIGGLFHIFGAYLILWFVTKEFGPKSYFKYLFYILFSIALIAFGLFISGKIFKIGSEIQKAPFEPFSYFVIRNYISDPVGISILYGIIILISSLIFGILVYNSLKVKEKRKKGLLYGIGSWFLIVPMVVCALLSPVFARIGYLIGAILIYKAFRLKG